MAKKFHTDDDSLDDITLNNSLTGLLFNSSDSSTAVALSTTTSTLTVDPTQDTYYYLQWYLDNSIGRYVDANGDYISGTVITAEAVFNNLVGADLSYFITSDGTQTSQFGPFPTVGLVAGIDLNIQGAWKDYSGVGVLIADFDDGLDTSIPDLIPNLSPLQDPAFNLVASVHATAISSFMVASAGILLGDPSDPSNTGIVGVAYNASLVEVIANIPGLVTATMAEYEYLAETADIVEAPIYTAFHVIDGVPGTILIDQEGRDGLGAIQIYAASNGRGTIFSPVELYEDNVNPTRYVAAVASLGLDGKLGTANLFGLQPAFEFSSPGSALLVSAPSSFVSTSFDYTFFNNTIQSPIGLTTVETFANSGASAMTSGVVALVLEANPDLGYRDVQMILALSARENDPLREEMGPFVLQGPILPAYTVHYEWQTNGADNWNGGGMHTSLDYGLGLIDATQAVRLAETWTKQSTYFNEAHLSSAIGGSINVIDGETETSSIAITSGLFDNFGNPMAGNAVRIEHVEITVNLDLSRTSFNDLTLTLIAPDGTRSTLFNQQHDLGLLNPDTFRSDFMSTQFMGMVAKPGDLWTLEVTNNITGNSTVTYMLPSGPQTFNTTPEFTTFDGSTANNTSDIVVTGWNLSIFGNVDTPNDTYFFTNELKNGTVLTDTDGGIDTINASAVAGSQVINLNGGAQSTFLVDSLYLFGTQAPDGTITPSHILTEVIYDGVTYYEATYTNDGPLLPDLMTRTMRIDSHTVIENVYAGVGNDKIIGNSADNILEGGRGSDFIIGGGGNNTASYSTSLHGVHVALTGVKVNDPGTDADGDVLVNIQNLTGSGHDDVLTGNARDNILTGLEGNDILRGGLGKDTFVFAMEQDGVNLGKVGSDADRVTDLKSADILSFTGVFDANTDVAVNEADLDFNTVFNASASVGGTAANDTIVTFSGGGTLTFFDISIASFTSLEAATAGNQVLVNGI